MSNLKKGEAAEAKAEAKEFPSGLVIICGIILIAAILTYIIPGGEYVRTEIDGRQVVDPNSFQYVASHPASIYDIFTAIPQGFIQTGWICFLILIVGGSFSVISGTGAIQAGLNSLVGKSKGKNVYFIPVIVLLFSIVPTLMGTLEAYLAFVPLGIMVARSMGLDALVGIAITVCAGGAGLASGITNTSIAIAQGLVGLPAFSGMWIRIAAYICFNISVSFWTMKYALMIKKDPEKSWCRDIELKAKLADKEDDLPIGGEFTLKHGLILLTVICGLAFIIYTALSGGDYQNGIPATFLMMLVVVGIIMRYSPNELMAKFGKGAQGVVSGVLVVGFAKAIAIVLDNSGTIDTIIYAACRMLDGASGVLTAEIMYLIAHIGNFFIISDSGLATVLVPILSPIGQVAGITQQSVAHAAILGGALGNMLMPTSPLTSGAIAIAEIDYRVYFKFAVRIFLTNSVVSAILVAIFTLVNVGPF